MLQHKPYTTKVFKRSQVMGIVSRPMGKERGRTKGSGGPGKKFSEPINGETALMKHRQFLSEEDRSDVFLYPEVFYLRRPWSNYKAPSNGFSFEQHGHIKFQYEQISVLGKGTFGIVIKCFDHKSQSMVAVKLVKDIPAEHQQLLNERNYMKTLMEFENGCQNNHIISLLDHFSFRGFSCFVTELGKCDVYAHLRAAKFRGLSVAVMRNMLRQTAVALDFVHRAGIVHSDLKPENMLVMDKELSQVSLMDFGCSCLDRHPLYKTVQSLYYRAPEVIFGFKYGREIDVWSFGCLAYELATGRPLFQAKDEQNLIQKHVRLIGEPPAEMVKLSPKMAGLFNGKRVDRAAANRKRLAVLEEALGPIHPELASLVSRCLEWLPAKRPTMGELASCSFFEV